MDRVLLQRDGTRKASITPRHAPCHIAFLQQTLGCHRASFVFNPFPARRFRHTGTPRFNPCRKAGSAARLHRRDRTEARVRTRDRGWNGKPLARVDHSSRQNCASRGYSENQGKFVPIPWRCFRVAGRLWRLHRERVASATGKAVYRESGSAPPIRHVRPGI